MANEVIVNVRVLNRSMVPVEDAPVMLMNPDNDTDPFNPNPTIVIASGNSDTNGYVQFTGVDAGTYDIKIVNSSGAASFNYGYIVKNSFVVDPANTFESRFSVRSGESIAGVGAGVLARTSDALGGMYSSYNFSKEPVETNAELVGGQPKIGLNGTATTYYQNQFDGVIFSVLDTIRAKQSGNSYYHDNQNVKLFQKVDIVISG